MVVTIFKPSLFINSVIIKLPKLTDYFHVQCLPQTGDSYLAGQKISLLWNIKIYYVHKSPLLKPI
jgi:hypothetical protein